MAKPILLIGLMISLLIGLAGCEKKTAKPAVHYTVITAQPKSLITPLHFSGTLEPLSAQSVLSPFDGRVKQVLFQYGQQLQKGQPLVTLDATKLSEDYRKTVSDFLEKKQSYETGLISYQGTEALYKAGVISKEEYSTASTSQQSNTLNYLQAKYDLEKLLVQTNINFASVEELKLTDMKQVNQTLNRQLQEVKVVAPTVGVALFPPPDQKKEGSGSGRINVGDDIKAGQLILSIGDLSGLTLKINVSEVSINLIKPDLAARVTGDAFPGIVLPGVVASVAAQANPQSLGAGNLGQFEVIVKVPKLTPAEQNTIRVGMSAAVELDIPESPMIYLPINAVYQKNGQSMVTLVTPTGEHRETPVVTGKTTLTEVAIVKGVSPGDRVAVPN
jgi:HlyD family secretion protein